MVCTLAVQLDCSRNGEWVVSADFLDELTVAGRTAISDYDVVKWGGFAAFSLQAKFDCHGLSS
jgi:hypothetical protein